MFEKLVNDAFTFDLNKPFPVESYCNKLYSSNIISKNANDLPTFTSQGDFCLQSICRQVALYEKSLSAKIANAHFADLKHLLESVVEPFLVGLQRLNDVCCRIQQRLYVLTTIETEAHLKSTLDTVERTIYKTCLCLLVKVLLKHFQLLMKIIKNELTSLLEESCSSKSKSSSKMIESQLSKLAQYILVLELRIPFFQVDPTEKSSSSFSFEAIICRPLFDCLQVFTAKASAQLLTTCTKENTINWRLYLESLINLWSTALKPTLYVAFVERLSKQPYKHCSPILPLSAEDEALLLSQRDRIQENARTVFFSVAFPQEKLSSLLRYIGESFVVLVQSKVKLYNNSNSSSSSKRLSTHAYTLIRLYYNINSSHVSMSTLFTQIDTRFSQLLEKTTTKDSGKKKHPPNSVHDNSTYSSLNRMRYLTSYERLLRRLMEDFLYSSPLCWDIIRNLMCRHVSDSQQEQTLHQQTEGQHKSSSFAKCLAGFMHFNLSSVHNNEPFDYTWLGKSCTWICTIL